MNDEERAEELRRALAQLWDDIVDLLRLNRLVDWLNRRV